MNIIKKIILGVAFLLCGFVRAGELPLNIAEIYAENSITDYKGQLILIDFWATWCAPCRAATIQLEILQEEFQKDLFVVSLTDETHETVEKYMNRFSIKLMVARDLAGNLFRKFNVSRRPYAVLLTAEGKVIWRGHPSDLKYNRLNQLIRQFKKDSDEHKQIEDFFTVFSPFERGKSGISEIVIEKSHSSKNEFLRTDRTVTYDGLLSNLIAKVYKTPNFFVLVEEKDKNFNIHAKLPIEIWKDPAAVLELLSEKFNFKVISDERIGKVYHLEVFDNTKLWDTNQIDWGANNIANYLIGEDRIQADNMSISDFCLLLSNRKMRVFTYSGNNKTLHDWDVHYLFDDLMTDELANEFGIRIIQKSERIEYLIIK